MKQTETLFDRPLYGDPLMWWVAFLVWGAVGTTWSSDYGRSVSGDTESLAFVIDLGFRLAFYLLVFAVVPATIRRNRRRSKLVEPAPDYES